MKSRCNNINNPDYRLYGGRGIKVCERWRQFENFLSDMGERPFRHSLDRINTNGDYEPKNCRWATHHVQMSNVRKNVFLSLNGKRKHLSGWARELGIDPSVLEYRVKMGWPVEQVLGRKSGRWLWDRRKLFVTVEGRKMSLTEISSKFGIPKTTLFYRLKNGLQLIPKDIQSVG